MMKWLRRLSVLLVSVVVLVIGAGQIGLLAGKPPEGLGVHDGLLAAPSQTPNSVSSQADRYPGHPRADDARIDPLRYSGDGAAAMARLAGLLRQMERTRIVEERTDYIRVEFQTPILRYTDDAEFWLDPSAGVIQLRSASRIGRRDLGTNRQRIELIRARFTTP